MYTFRKKKKKSKDNYSFLRQKYNNHNRGNRNTLFSNRKHDTKNKTKPMTTNYETKVI